MSEPSALRALVVDDNEIVRRAAVAMLTHLGAKVDSAADVAEGVRLATESAYDLLVVDVRLAGASGMEVARRVKASPSSRPPRIVGLTGDADDDLVDACREAGMADVLFKPVKLADLERELEIARER